MYRNKRDNWKTIKLQIIGTLSRFVLGYLSTRYFFLKSLNYPKKEIIKKSYTEDENTSSYKDQSKNTRKRVQNAPEHGRTFGVQEPVQHSQSKNTRRRVQNALEHGITFGVQEPIQQFWSAERHFKRAEFPPFGLWPNGIRVTIRHTLFNLLTKG